MKRYIIAMLAAAALASCNNAAHDEHHAADETISKNKEIAQGFYDKVMNAHSSAMIDSFCAPGYIEHSTDPNTPPTREGLKTMFREMFTGFPDLKITSNFVVAEGDIVATHYTMKGTNTGTIMGMPANNKPFDVSGIDMLKIKDGKIVEHWGYYEEGKMMKQMGMMPPPPPPPAEPKK